MGGRYRDLLRCDVLLREFLEGCLKGLFVSSIEIERSENALRVIIKTSRPGMLIGRSGEGATKLRNDMMAFVKRRKLTDTVPELKLDIEEVRSPESNAAVVAQMVVEGIEKRMPFRRLLKQTVEKVMANRDVGGVHVRLSGRLDGGDMARREDSKRGRVPLQTFRADIDYARATAHIPQGAIGIKVWIYKGEVFSENQGAKRL